MQGNTPPDFTLKTDRDRDLSAEQVVVAYHERTKHHYHRYAAALGYMDWVVGDVPEMAILVKPPDSRLLRPDHFPCLWVFDRIVEVGAFVRSLIARIRA